MEGSGRTSSKWKFLSRSYFTRLGTSNRSSKVFPAISRVFTRERPADVARISTSGVLGLQYSDDDEVDDVDTLSLAGGLRASWTKVQELTNAFDSSFVRVLKPRIHANERVEITTLACSSCGKYVVAGSNLFRQAWVTPGTPGSSVEIMSDSEEQPK
eukprot:scaffold389789_cov50-Prasinocladus_malaysianus.AAC.1